MIDVKSVALMENVIEIDFIFLASLHALRII